MMTFVGIFSSPLTQVQAVSDAVQRVRRDRGSAKNDLFFFAHVPALGFATYQVTSAKQGMFIYEK